MNFQITIVGSGKIVRLEDLTTGARVVNDEFLNAGTIRDVDVASNDGRTGNIRLLKRLNVQAGWTAQYDPYQVSAGENIDVDDP